MKKKKNRAKRQVEGSSPAPLKVGFFPLKRNSPLGAPKAASQGASLRAGSEHGRAPAPAAPHSPRRRLPRGVNYIQAPQAICEFTVCRSALFYSRPELEILQGLVEVYPNDSLASNRQNMNGAFARELDLRYTRTRATSLNGTNQQLPRPVVNYSPPCPQANAPLS